MPELPEVETVRMGLAPVIEHHRFTRVITRRGNLRVPFPPNFAERLNGRTVELLERRAKYLLAGLDSGETLVDSAVIIDHLDEVYGRERALTPEAGADRRAVLKLAAIMMGACEKGLQAAYTRNHTPPEKLHQPWIDDCKAQVTQALAAVDAMIDPSQTYLLLGRLTQADITAFIAERLGRTSLGIDTDAEMPHLRSLTRKLAEEPAFRATEP